MGYNAYAAILGLLFLCSSVLADAGYAEYDTGYTGAWEIDYSRCDRGGADTMDYCDAYCEYETYEECFYVSHIDSDAPGMVGQCVCTCGVSQETVTFNNVPCKDLTRYAEPIGSSYSDDYDYGNSGCCLPMFLLIGVAGFAFMRR